MAEDSTRGSAVYAAAFLRDRKIIFEAGLLSTPDGFRLILLHELFHFAWPRLGNEARRQFSHVLKLEWDRRAHGELGESSGVMKAALGQHQTLIAGRSWRNYVCESFCDTAAWLYGGVSDHRWFTLRKRWRERRQDWFQTTASQGPWKC